MPPLLHLSLTLPQSTHTHPTHHQHHHHQQQQHPPLPLPLPFGTVACFFTCAAPLPPPWFSSGAQREGFVFVASPSCGRAACAIAFYDDVRGACVRLSGGRDEWTPPPACSQNRPPPPLCEPTDSPAHKPERGDRQTQRETQIDFCSIRPPFATCLAHAPPHSTQNPCARAAKPPPLRFCCARPPQSACAVTPPGGGGGQNAAACRPDDAPLPNPIPLSFGLCN